VLSDVTLTAEFPVPENAVATRWIDGLHADGATVLARYDHPHFGRSPAITWPAAWYPPASLSHSRSS